MSFLAILTFYFNVQVLSLISTDTHSRYSGSRPLSMLTDGNEKSRKKVISPSDLGNLFKNGKNSPKVEFDFIEIDSNIYNDDDDEGDTDDSTPNEETNLYADSKLKSPVENDNIRSIFMRNEDEPSKQVISPPPITSSKVDKQSAVATPTQSDDDICYDDNDYLDLSNIVDKVRQSFI